MGADFYARPLFFVGDFSDIAVGAGFQPRPTQGFTLALCSELSSGPCFRSPDIFSLGAKITLRVITFFINVVYSNNDSASVMVQR